MTQTKKPSSKKAASKKSEKKVQPQPAAKLPDAVVLPRGQERLPDGTIRLKTGAHNLNDVPTSYDVHGMRIELSGKVLIAGKDVDWISVGKCQKCSAKRDNIIVRRAANGLVAIMFECHSSENDCDLGQRLYVQVHSQGRFIFQE